MIKTMDCQKVIDVYKDLFDRIKRLKPLKDEIIFIKIEDCFIKLISKNKQLSILPAKVSERMGEILIKFTDFNSFKQIMDAKDLIDYGERLLYAALDKKVLLDPGKFEKATKSGFYKLLCRSRYKKHIQVFELTIPVL
ncbi:MAG: hypothetical protein ACTSRG_12280 [Candidatus Helarchaeota archaeon]